MWNFHTYLLLFAFYVQVTLQFCLTTHEYYDYLTNTCLPCAYNCLTCFDSSLCVACATSYYLDTTNHVCLSCGYGCGVCTDADTCTTCLAGLYIDANGECQACDIGVSGCTIALVQSCSDGYFMLGDICAGCLDNCRSCGDFITCTQCQTSFYLNSDQTDCLACSDNCQVCSDGSTCTSCAQGYSLSSSSACQLEDCSSISPFCLKCSGSNCLECQVGKYLSSGDCVQGASLLCLEAYGPYFTDCQVSNYQCPSYANVQTDPTTGSQIDVCLPKHSDSDHEYVYLSYSTSECVASDCALPFSKAISFTTLKSFHEVAYYINLQLYGSATHTVTVTLSTSITSNLTNTHSIDITDEYAEGLEESGCSGCIYGITLISSTMQISGTTTSNQLTITSDSGQFTVLQVLLSIGVCNVQNCEECTTSNDCEACTSPQYLQLIECVSSCDAGFYLDDRECVLECPSDTYPVRATYTCEDCVSPCLTCSSESQCLSCVSGYFLEGTACNTNCSDNTLYPDPDTQVCEECPNPCTTCQIVNTTVSCLSCDVGYLYETNGSCTYICPEGTYSNFVDNITQCSDCHAACTSCYITSQVCTSCTDGYLLDESSCNANYTCPEGYYENNETNSCEKCHYPCDECTGDQYTCTSCLKGALYSSSCPLTCPEGMYIHYYNSSNSSNGTQVCEDCPSPCVFCEGSSFCLSCENGTYLYEGGCYAQCPTDEYYEESANNSCVKCIPPCSLCSSASSCLQCSTGYFDPMTTTCTLQCNDTSYVQSNFTCTLCPSPCSKCYSNTSCTECDLPYVLYEQSCITQSECYALNRYIFYYYDYQTDPATQISAACRSCTFPCESCSSSAIECDTCSSGYIMVTELSICVQECPVGYYQTSSANVTCEPCDDECFTCDVAADNCTSCGTGMYLHEWECLLECPTYYYGSNYDALCYACETPCEECYSLYLCKTCLTGILYNKVCVDDCPEGSLLNQTTNSCDVCTDNCLTCSVVTSNCTDCPNGFYYLDYECLVTCPSGYYEDYYSKNCELCVSPCETCSSSSACESCVSGYYLYEDDCMTDCPTGYYEGNGTCDSCNTTICRSCSATPDNCSDCAAGYYFDSLVEGACVSSCPSSTYADTYTLTCKQCTYPCTVCTSASYCTDCQSGYKLYSDYCYSSCPVGFYENNGTCDQCSSTCQICEDETTCTKCIDNYYIQNGGCVRSCDDGYYGGYASLTNYATCLSCEVGCALCTSSYDCTECDATTSTIYLFNGLCFDECPILHYATSSNQCEECPQYCNQCTNSTYCTQCLNSYIYKNLCYLTCPTYTYPFNQQSCLDCVSPCLQCSSQYVCISCVDNYMYYQSYCVRSCPDDVWYYPENKSCSGSCPYNKYEDGMECYISGCGGRMVEHNGYCLENCPDNYYVNAEQSCAECTGTLCDELFVGELTPLRTNNLILAIHFSQQSEKIKQSDIVIVFQNSDDETITYAASSYTIDEYRILINFGYRSLTLHSVTVTLPYVCSQTSSQCLYRNALSASIDSYNNYQQYKDENSLQWLALICVIVGYVLVVINIVVKNSHFLQVVDFMQFVAATLYLEIQYPVILQRFLYGMGAMLWNWSPSFSTYLPYTFSPSKFYEYHEDSSIARGHGLTMLVFLLIISTLLIILLVHHCKKQTHPTLNKVVKRIRYRHLNDTFSIFMLPLLMFAFNIDGASAGDIFVSLMVIILCVGFVLVVAYKIMTVRKAAELPGLLSEVQEDTQTKLSLMYAPFTYVRKIIFSFTLCIQPDQPISTLTLLLIFTVLILVCLYFYKPFKNHVTGYICIGFQLVLVVYGIILMLFGLNIFESNQTAAHYVGLVVAVIVGLMTLVGLGWTTYLTVIGVKTACQKWKKEQEEEESQEKVKSEKKNSEEDSIVKNAQQYESQKISVKQKRSSEDELSAQQLFQPRNSGFSAQSSSNQNEEFRHWNPDSESEGPGNKQNPPTYLVKMDKPPMVIEDLDL